MATEKDVLAALSTVMDPELNVSLVQAGMVKSVRIDGGRVAATIELTTPACPLKGKIQADAEAALKKLPGVTGLDVTWAEAVNYSLADWYVFALLSVPVIYLARRFPALARRQLKNWNARSGRSWPASPCSCPVSPAYAAAPTPLSGKK